MRILKTPEKPALIILLFLFGLSVLVYNPLKSMIWINCIGAISFFFYLPGSLIKYGIIPLFSKKEKNIVLDSISDIIIESIHIVLISLLWWALFLQILIYIQIPLVIGVFKFLYGFFAAIFLICVLIIVSFENLTFISIQIKIKWHSLKHTLNLLLFIGLLFLLAIFWALKTPYLAVDDTWFHVSYSIQILQEGTPNFSIYNSKFLYHYMGASFSLLSKLDMFIIAKWIGIFQISQAGLIFWAIMENLSNNRNITILTSLLFITSSLGNFINFCQYWPTAFTSIFFLYFIFVFIKRIQTINKIEKIFPRSEQQTKLIILNLWLKRMPIILPEIFLLLAIAFLHIVNIFFFLLPVILTLFLLMLKNKGLILDFLTYLILFGFASLINTESRNILTTILHIQRPWLILFVLIGLIIGSIVIFEKYIVSKITYQMNSKNPQFSNDNSSISIEKRYLKTLIFPSIALSISLLYFLLSNDQNGFNSSNKLITAINVGICSYVFVTAVFSFLLFRQFNYLGKLNYVIMNAVILITLGVIIFPIDSTYSGRVVQIYLPLFFLNLGLYWKYVLLYKSKVPKNSSVIHNYSKFLKREQLFIFFITFSLFTTDILHHITYKDYLTENEFLFLNAYNDLTNEEEATLVLIIGNFHYSYPMKYIAEYHNTEMIYSHQLVNIIANGNNQQNLTTYFEQNLAYLQSESNTSEIFVLLTDYDISMGFIGLEGSDYGKITQEYFIKLTNVRITNRIACSKSKMTIFQLT